MKTVLIPEGATKLANYTQMQKLPNLNLACFLWPIAYNVSCFLLLNGNTEMLRGDLAAQHHLTRQKTKTTKHVEPHTTADLTINHIKCYSHT